MIKHIVFWKLHPEALGRTKAENALELKRRIEAMRGRIPGLLRCEGGVDFGGSEAAADVALYAEFESRAALALYQEHPEHLALKEFLAHVRRERIVVDYDV